MAGGVVVLDGVIDGVQVIVGVKVGNGVAEGNGVAVGSGVLVGGGGGVGVQVTVGVEDGVQEMIGLGTASRRSWQPLAKSMITPKSLLTTPGNGPPPAQSLSKSICPDIRTSSVKRQAASPIGRGADNLEFHHHSHPGGSNFHSS